MHLISIILILQMLTSYSFKLVTTLFQSITACLPDVDPESKCVMDTEVTTPEQATIDYNYTGMFRN